MREREAVVRACFRAWLDKDVEGFAGCFSEGAVYVESWGPMYRSRAEILRWFTDWNREGDVLRWEIGRFWHDGDSVVCDWGFACRHGGVDSAFDGMTVARFDGDGRICWLKEYQCRVSHVLS